VSVPRPAGRTSGISVISTSRLPARVSPRPRTMPGAPSANRFHEMRHHERGREPLQISEEIVIGRSRPEQSDRPCPAVRSAKPLVLAVLPRQNKLRDQVPGGSDAGRRPHSWSCPSAHPAACVDPEVRVFWVYRPVLPCQAAP